MRGLKDFLNKFSTRIDLLSLVVIAVFFSMVSPVEEILDIENQGSFLFLAVGKHGVRVLDTGLDPGNPVEVGLYDTIGSANALAIHADGDQQRLYVADGKAGIAVYEITGEGELRFLWRDKTISPALDIAVQNGYAMVARGRNGLSSVHVEGYPRSSGKNYVWPVADIENALMVNIQGSRAYMIDESWVFHVVDFSEPKNPLLKKSIPIGYAVNDFDIYGGVAYIATNQGGLIFLDLNLPQGDEVITQYTDFPDVQNVTVYGAFAYISGGTDGIQVLEISDPRSGVIPVGGIRQVEAYQQGVQRVADQRSNGNPIMATIDARKLVQVGENLYFSDGVKGLRTLNTHQIIDIQVKDSFGGVGADKGWVEDVSLIIVKDDKGVIKNSYAYLAGGERGLWVLDTTIPHSPQDITDAFVDKTGGYASAVATRPPYAYVAYGKRGVGIFNTGDPRIPVLSQQYELGWEALDLTILDDRYLYVAAGSGGLRIIDVDNKLEPFEISAEDTPGNAVGVAVFDNHAYVADGNQGLQVINILDRLKPTLVATGDTSGDARAVAIFQHRLNQESPLKTYAYVADGSSGVAIFEVSNPQVPRFVKAIETKEFAQDVTVVNNRLYLSERAEGMIIYDLFDPENPVRKGSVDTPGQAVGIYVAGDYAYVADYHRGLRIINVANPDDPREYGFFDMPTQVKDLTIVANTYAYLVDGSTGLWTVNLEKQDNPIPINFLGTPGDPSSITRDGLNIYVADGNRGLHLVDITRNPVDPTITASFEAFDRKVDVRDVKARGVYAFVANGESGLPVLDLSDPAHIRQIGVLGTKG